MVCIYTLTLPLDHTVNGEPQKIKNTHTQTPEEDEDEREEFWGQM